MAAVNFPNTPSEGDTHTHNGKTWVFLGSTWVVVGANVVPAFTQANLSNTLTVANTLANGYVIIRSSERSKLNFIPASSNVSIKVEDDAAGDRINVTIDAVSGSGSGSGSGMNLTAGNTLANGFYFTRTTGLANINFIDEGLLTWNVDTDATNFRINVSPTLSRAPFAVANNANLYANLAFMAANAVYGFANTMNINVAATMVVANTANLYANLAFRAANAVYDFANVMNINVAATMLVANNANVYANLAFRAANAAYDFANAINIKVDTTGNSLSNVANTYSNGYVVLQSSRGTLNFMADTTDLKIRIQDNSTHGLTNVRFDAPGIGLAYGVANAAKTEADAVFGVANVHNGAILSANTIAIAAFDVANAHNGAMAQMNTAIFGVANNANLYANLAFRAANAVYDFANTININVAATMVVANTANLYANLAFRAANAVYDFANTININVAATMIVANVANARANLAQMASNAVYDFANTMNINVAATMIVANTANLYANLAFMAANGAFDKANSANLLALAAFNGANNANAWANYAMIAVNAAFIQANTSNLVAVGNTMANTYFTVRGNRTRLNFVPSTNMTINVEEDAAGDRINITLAASVAGATDMNLTVGNTLANGYYVTRSAAYANLNLIDDALIAWNVDTDVANFRINAHAILSRAPFNVANNANLYANLAFMAANAVYGFANTININVAATMIVANTANLYANLAFRAANAVFDFANTMNINVAATMLVANNANVYANLAFRAANAAYDFANTINVYANSIQNVANTYSNGYVVLQSSRGTLNFMADTTDLKIRIQDNSTHGLTNVRFDAPGIGLAYGVANAAKTEADAVFGVANVHNGAITAANTIAIAAFDVANAHNGAMAQMNVAIFAVANNANLYANLAFRAANAAYDFANAINIKVDTTGNAISNVANTYSNGYVVLQSSRGTLNFMADTTDLKIRIQDNSTHGLTNVRFDAPGIGLAYGVANAAKTEADAVFGVANVHNGAITAANTIAIAAFDVANAHNGAMAQMNVAIFSVANNANLYANLAFRAANAVYDFANVININVAATMLTANFANILANSLSNVAQTYSNGYVVLQSSRGTLNFMADTTDLKIRIQDNSTHGLTNVRFDAPGIGLAYAQSNIAMLTASTAYDKANLANQLANGAFLQANQANLLAVGNTLPNTYFLQRASRSKLNFIDSTSVTWNITDDAAGDRVNVVVALSQSAGSDKNTMVGNTTAAGVYTNRAGPYSNINFLDDALLTWNINDDATAFRANVYAILDRAPFNTANTANLYANLAFRAANSVYDFANTININVAATMIVANVANARANLAQMASNAAFNLANSANILANQVFAVGNTYSNGYQLTISTRGTLNFVAETTDVKVYVQDNATHGLANVVIGVPGVGSAYGQANAAKTEADAVFGVANVHNAAMAQMNTAIFGVANTANLYANLAFMAANAVYAFANTMNINVAATMIVANTANVRANLAQMASNAAFGLANVANVRGVGNTMSNGYFVVRSTRGTLNFQPASANVTINIVDDSAGDRVNVVIESYSSGGGGASGPPVQVSDAEPGTTTANSLWFKSSTGQLFVRYNDGTSTQWVEVGAFGDGLAREEVWTYAITPETSAVAGGGAFAIHVAKGMTITSAFASCSANGSSGNTHIDVNKNGTTIFTNNLTIRAANSTSDTQATQPTLTASPTTFIRGDLISIDIDLVSTSVAGLKVHLIGFYT